jgi:hypothetical protein
MPGLGKARRDRQKLRECVQEELRTAPDLRSLLQEARDFIDHRPHHDQPYQPDAPCCDLERRIDEALHRTAAR